MTRPPHRARRGFSMLEMVMAASIGSLVIVVCISVFYTMERAETMLAKRASHSSDLERLRFVAQRATSTLVMSTDRQPAPRQGEGEAEGVSRFGRGRTTETSDVAPIPRLILGVDPRAQGWIMRSTGGRDFSADATPVQRLEMVLSDPPVPTADNDFFLRAGLGPGERRARRQTESRFDTGSKFKGGSTKDGTKTSKFSKSSDDGESRDQGTTAAADDKNIQPANSLETEGEAEQGSVRAVRGALEIRRQELTARDVREAAADDAAPPEAFEVWWVPLPPRANGSSPPSADEIAAAGEPFRIAGNLRFVKWQVFDDRVWKSALESTWEQHLPAYIRLSAETTTGLTADWTFEVDWARGPEVPPESSEGVRRAVSVDESGAASTGSGPGRTTTTRPPTRAPGPARATPKQGQSPGGKP